MRPLVILILAGCYTLQLVAFALLFIAQVHAQYDRGDDQNRFLTRLPHHGESETGSPNWIEGEKSLFSWEWKTEKPNVGIYKYQKGHKDMNAPAPARPPSSSGTATSTTSTCRWATSRFLSPVDCDDDENDIFYSDYFTLVEKREEEEEEEEEAEAKATVTSTAPTSIPMTPTPVPAGLPPPMPDTTKSELVSSGKNQGSGSDLNVPALAGGIGGGVVLLTLIGLATFMLARSRKRGKSGPGINVDDFS